MCQVLLESRDYCSAAITGPGTQLSLGTDKNSLLQNAFNQLIVEINLIRIPVRIGVPQDTGLPPRKFKNTCVEVALGQGSERSALGIGQSHWASGGSTTWFWVCGELEVTGFDVGRDLEAGMGGKGRSSRKSSEDKEPRKGCCPLWEQVLARWTLE